MLYLYLMFIYTLYIYENGIEIHINGEIECMIARSRSIINWKLRMKKNTK